MLKSAYPAAVHLGDLRELTAGKLKDALKDCGEVQFILETAGTPCQDLSSANASGKGLQGRRSSLFFDLEANSELYAEVAPKADVRRLLENVASMASEDRDTITQMRGQLPYKACPSGKFPLRRPRFFWCDWEIPGRPGLTAKGKVFFY